MAWRLLWPASMSTSILTTELAASVLLSSEELVAEVRDRRPTSLVLFGELDGGQREQLVLDAWRIGLRALHNAHVTAQEAKLKDVGETLLKDIDQQLHNHVSHQQDTIAAVLTRFFDPKDGQVTQRLTAFVDDQGVLARQLDKFLGPRNSVLAETLARQVGETSPLFKKLSPTDSAGLAKTLEAQLQAVMNQGHGELLRALDPLNDDGAVARFLRSLREELKGADQDRQQQLSAALAALDANDEDSLLSRLVRETQRAREEVLAAVNPEFASSPLSVLRASLTKLLQEQGATHAELSEKQEARQTQFEKEIREAVGRIEAKRIQGQSSPRGGLDFEDAVISFLRTRVQGAPCLFDSTGATQGVGRSKKGDAVLRFTDESAFVGAGVVFEAKHEAGYTVQKALAELDQARKNRDVVAGVFVMARSHASDAFPRFARYGNSVLVIWDDADPETDAYLHAALLLGMGLVTRSRTTGDSGDIAAMNDVGARIEAELSRLEKMEKYSESIRKNVDGISDEVRKAQKALDLLLRKAQSTLRALDVEVYDEDGERETPISLRNSSFSTTTHALPDEGAVAQ